MSDAALQSDFLDELHHDARELDVVKARYLMDSLPEHDTQFQTLVLSELKEMDYGFQAAVLGYVVATPTLHLAAADDVVAAQLMQAVQAQPEALAELLADGSLPDRSRLLELCDVVAPDAVVPSVRRVLAGATDVSEIKTLLLALGRLGANEAVPAIDEYLYATERELVQAAVTAMAEIESLAAIDCLGRRLGHDTQIDTMIMQVLADLATSYAIELLARQLSASSAYTRTRAKEHLIRLGARAIPVVINLLENMDIDAQIHALNVMGAIGDEVAIPPIRHLLHSEPADANVRFAAYEALGFLPDRISGYVLAAGLNDEDGSVRIAAAKAIERNLDARVSAGLANLTRERNEETGRIMQAMAEARAERSILGLMPQAAFSDMLVDYLNDHAHPDVFEFVHDLLQRNAQTEVLTRLTPKAAGADVRGRVFAVDDSRMILNIYKSQLYELGYEIETFEFPAEALQRIIEQPPDLVFTDLNMPELDGVELTKAIRKHHDAAALPVVMVTTQSEGGDAAAARAGGVNQILHKPFTGQDLQGALNELLST